MLLEYLLPFLVKWLVANSDYKDNKLNLKVNIVSVQEVQEKACAGKCPIIAFYDKNKGIFIKDMDFKDLCNQSILLHEIVHAFQDHETKNLTYPFREKEAYEIQNKFLENISKEKNFYEILSIKKCRSIQFYKESKN
tara:strand:- start:524 stop:934 length:411 start_codon:yes stop_codon:yes gene_type:complete